MRTEERNPSVVTFLDEASSLRLIKLIAGPDWSRHFDQVHDGWYAFARDPLR